jgi:hypothetical protein
MNVINRAVAVLTRPRPTLAASAQEPATTSTLFTGYGLPLAALPVIGSLLALLLFAASVIGSFLLPTLIMLLLMFALRDVAVTFVMGRIAGALASRLGGQSNKAAAMKLVVYAATAIWVAGFFAAVLGALMPEASVILRFAGFGMACYLLYVGSGPLLGIPQNQAGIFAGLLTVLWFIIYLTAEWIVMRLYVSMLYSSAMGGGLGL